MKLKFCYSSKVKPFEGRISAIFELLKQLEKRGIECEYVDTNGLSHSSLQEIYIDAVTPSVRKKYGIRRVFGTRRQSGIFFGKQVPALLVYEAHGRYPTDVYPHVERGRTVTVEEYLRMMLRRFKKIKGQTG
jgi:hypothetical protein